MHIRMNSLVGVLERIAERSRIHCLCCPGEWRIFFLIRLLLTLHFLQEKEVRKWKEELLEQRRKMMEEKLLHAEFKRELQLQAIVKKAQEEDAKV